MLTAQKGTFLPGQRVNLLLAARHSLGLPAWPCTALPFSAEVHGERSRFPLPVDSRFRGEMETVAVIDFETTGASPDQSRATEIAVVLVREG